ncbi:hypothetical protein ABZ860_23745 [Microbispora sp. NPDC046973]|uniref:hypothetical protein n=1 Tax=Microbispora sp. NPDC046973 TaxID=3155022 RepID=UPI0033DBC491
MTATAPAPRRRNYRHRGESIGPRGRAVNVTRNAAETSFSPGIARQEAFSLVDSYADVIEPLDGQVGGR